MLRVKAKIQKLLHADGKRRERLFFGTTLARAIGGSAEALAAASDRTGMVSISGIGLGTTGNCQDSIM